MKNNTNRRENSWVNARGLEKAVLVLPTWKPQWSAKNITQLNIDNQQLVFRISVQPFYDKYADQMHQLLRPEEIQRCNALKLERTRLKFAVGKMALRMILGALINSEGKELRFKRNRWGKPDLIDKKLAFNTSYSGGWLLIAVSGKHKVGVDIEAINKAFDYRPLVESYFHPEEKQKLSDSFSFSQKTFFQLWTRKEALAKVIGLGLHERLLHTNMLDESIPYQKNNSSSFFVIHSFSVDNQHVGALAMRNIVQAPTFYDFL